MGANGLVADEESLLGAMTSPDNVRECGVSLVVVA